MLSKVTSLTRAITMLGMNTVKNMALSTTIIQAASPVITRLTWQEKEDRRKITIVSLANMYVNILDIGYAGDPFPAYENTEELLELTGLFRSDLAAIGGTVEAEIEKAQIFLQV